MARRSKLEIWLDVLNIINGGTSKPTRIMYAANISWDTLQQILGSMQSRELIMEVDTRHVRRRDRRTKRRYEITQKGENVVRYFRRARVLFKLEEVSTIRRLPPDVRRLWPIPPHDET